MKDMNREEREHLERMAAEIRIMALETVAHLGTGHVGGIMSVIELLTVLYYRRLRHNPEYPHWEERDRLVLSKGHAGPALYATLAKRGFFPLEWLLTLNRGGTRLPSHADMNKTPGVDMTTGSLGQGISAAIGMALADRLDKKERNVYLIVGDGECNEGQIWEGAMAAAHFKLDKLIAFTDYNGLQIDGFTKDIMNIDDLNAKWAAFGWQVQRVDGHDVCAIDQAINAAQAERGRPSMIIMDTIKAKGCMQFENTVESHNMPFGKEVADEIIKALKQSLEVQCGE